MIYYNYIIYTQKLDIATKIMMFSVIMVSLSILGIWSTKKQHIRNFVKFIIMTIVCVIGCLCGMFYIDSYRQTFKENNAKFYTFGYDNEMYYKKYFEIAKKYQIDGIEKLKKADEDTLYKINKEFKKHYKIEISDEDLKKQLE